MCLLPYLLLYAELMHPRLYSKIVRSKDPPSPPPHPAEQPQPNQRVHLLDLPPEIRILIYNFVFADLPKPGPDVYITEFEEPIMLLYTCRQIRREALQEFKKKLRSEMPGLAPTIRAIEEAWARQNALREAKGVSVIGIRADFRRFTLRHGLWRYKV